MVDNTLLEAKVKISIDKSSVDKSIKDVKKKFENQFSNVDTKIAKQLTKQLDRDIKKLSREFERAAKQLSNVLKTGLKFGIGLGTSSIYAFLKSGSVEALNFSHSLDKLKIAWGKVGQTLATKIKFGKFTGQELLNKLINKIENLDTSQIQKIVDYFTQAAKIWAGIKITEGVIGLAKITSTVVSLSTTLAKLSAINTATVVGGTVARVATTAAGAGAGAIGAGAVGGSAVTRAIMLLFSKMDRMFASANTVTPAIGALIGLKGTKPLSSKQALMAGYKFSDTRQTNIWGAPGIKEEIKSILATSKTIIPKYKAMFNLGRGLNLATGVLGRVAPVASAGYEGYKDYKQNNNLGRALGLGASNLAGSVLGLKIGATIGTTIAPGIGTALGGLIGSIAGTLGASSLFKTFFPGKSKEVIPSEETNQNIFSKPVKSLQYAELYSKIISKFSDDFVGGQLPLKERKLLVPGAHQQMTKVESDIKTLEAGEQTDIVKEQLQKLYKAKNDLRSFIDDTIILDRNQIDNQKQFEESKADADKRIQKKIKQNQQLTEKEDAELLGTNKKPTGGSISRGSIEDIPDLLSDNINDSFNNREEEIYELEKRQTEIEEERRLREEELKEMIDHRNKEVKEYEEKMLRLTETFSNALFRLTGGSSTVITI